MNLDNLAHRADALRAEIAKRVLGQEDLVDLVLTALFARGHILLEGVPGTAKTLIAKTLAHLVAADFGRIRHLEFAGLLDADLSVGKLFHQAFQGIDRPGTTNIVVNLVHQGLKLGVVFDFKVTKIEVQLFVGHTQLPLGGSASLRPQNY